METTITDLKIQIQELKVQLDDLKLKIKNASLQMCLTDARLLWAFHLLPEFPRIADVDPAFATEMAMVELEETVNYEEVMGG